MKKVIVFVFAILIAFTIIGCTKQNVSDEVSSVTTTSETTVTTTVSEEIKEDVLITNEDDYELRYYYELGSTSFDNVVERAKELNLLYFKDELASNEYSYDENKLEVKMRVLKINGVLRYVVFYDEFKEDDRMRISYYMFKQFPEGNHDYLAYDSSQATSTVASFVKDYFKTEKETIEIDTSNYKKDENGIPYQIIMTSTGDTTYDAVLNKAMEFAKSESYLELDNQEYYILTPIIELWEGTPYFVYCYVETPITSYEICMGYEDGFEMLDSLKQTVYRISELEPICEDNSKLDDGEFIYTRKGNVVTRTVK